jgi:hypothetical protein
MSLVLIQNSSTISSPSITSAILIGLYIALLGFFILLVISRYKIKKDRRRLEGKVKQLERRNNEESLKNNRYQDKANTIRLKYTEQIGALKDRISQLERELSTKNNNELQEVSLKDSSNISSEEQNTADSEGQQLKSVTVEFTVHTTFFLGFPDTESAFYAPEATESPTEESFYKIKGDQLFLYEEASPATMQSALNFIENHVKRACIILNARESFHSKLIMEEPGRIERVDDDYRIIDKLRVRYE